MPIQVSPEQVAWEKRCSPAITSDVLWRLDVYRAALYLAHVACADCRPLRSVRALDDVVSQLLHAAGSVSAALSEGYSRATRTDRIHFLGYSLGSARECVSWYSTVRVDVPEKVIEERLILIGRVRALLLGLIRSMRGKGKVGEFQN